MSLTEGSCVGDPEYQCLLAAYSEIETLLCKVNLDTLVEDEPNLKQVIKTMFGDEILEGVTGSYNIPKKNHQFEVRLKKGIASGKGKIDLSGVGTNVLYVNRYNDTFQGDYKFSSEKSEQKVQMEARMRNGQLEGLAKHTVSGVAIEQEQVVTSNCYKDGCMMNRQVIDYLNGSRTIEHIYINGSNSRTSSEVKIDGLNGQEELTTASLGSTIDLSNKHSVLFKYELNIS